MITNLQVSMIENQYTGNVQSGMYTTLNLPMMQDDSLDYYVRSIEGLTPVQVEYDKRSIIGTEGHIFDSVRYDVRQIILTLSYNERLTSVYEARTNLYRWFWTGNAVRLVFTVNNYKVFIDGIVKIHEANVFSDEPLSQITIECHYPYFRTLDPIVKILDNIPNLSGNFRIPQDTTYGSMVIPAPLVVTYRTGYRTTRLRVYTRYPKGAAYAMDIRNISVDSGRDIVIRGIPGEKDVYHKATPENATRTTLVGHIPVLYEWPHTDVTPWFFYYLIEQEGVATTPGDGFFKLEYHVLKVGL